jgi:predicted HTH domain antitoxin
MLTLELPPHVDEARARLILAIGLFQEEEVSVGKAAEIAGLSYRAFLDALRERGIPAYIYDDDEDGRREIEAIQSAVRERHIET